ncbi:FadR/GntR family transcriptional regulator [Lonepinella sp. BR2474]|uniref:FadR/GntR family transcriptional regulator n=1 Tax=Lonepinella sp. BR2474 TaxID=3434548 RepID=UPI003F6DB5B3
MKKSAKKEASLALQEKIKHIILQRHLKAGDLMPTENELIEQLEVSRSSLREAIKSLEALHILDIQHGVGTFVGQSSMTPMIRTLAFHAQLDLANDCQYLLNILDVREILQYGFASLTLARISDEEVEQLQLLVKQLQQQARQQQYALEIEKAIHLQTYQSVHNPLLSQYLDAFWQIFELLDTELPAPPYTPTELAMLYQEWVDAVESRDVDRFQHSILSYFHQIRQRLIVQEKQ